MADPEPRRYVQTVTMHTTSGTWTKPAGLVWVRVICVGAGGGGRASGTGGGGGGGAVVESDRLHASRLPETVPIIVGQSGIGQPGGESSFLDLRAPGGQPGTASSGGAGGLAPWRGGNGGDPGQGGESVSQLPVTTWAGGGGGAGSGSGWGGQTGGNLGFLPGLLTAGYGGSSHLAPKWPGGGGGIGQAGAGGVVTIIETLLEED